jgi:hypothetical protein
MIKQQPPSTLWKLDACHVTGSLVVRGRKGRKLFISFEKKDDLRCLDYVPLIGTSSHCLNLKIAVPLMERAASSSHREGDSWIQLTDERLRKQEILRRTSSSRPD